MRGFFVLILSCAFLWAEDRYDRIEPSPLPGWLFKPQPELAIGVAGKTGNAYSTIEEARQNAAIYLTRNLKSLAISKQGYMNLSNCEGETDLTRGFFVNVSADMQLLKKIYFCLDNVAYYEIPGYALAGFALNSEKLKAWPNYCQADELLLQAKENREWAKKDSLLADSLLICLELDPQTYDQTEFERLAPRIADDEQRHFATRILNAKEEAACLDSLADELYNKAKIHKVSADSLLRLADQVLYAAVDTTVYASTSQPEWYQEEIMLDESITACGRAKSVNLPDAWMEALSLARLKIAKYQENNVKTGLFTDAESEKTIIVQETEKILQKLSLKNLQINVLNKDNLFSYQVTVRMELKK